MEVIIKEVTLDAKTRSFEEIARLNLVYRPNIDDVIYIESNHKYYKVKSVIISQKELIAIVQPNLFDL